MDFGTISQNLAQGSYTTIEDFEKHVELIFNNCRKFNPPSTYPVTCADTVEKVFKREWAKATEKKLSWGEKRGLQAVITTVVKEDVCVHFYWRHTSYLIKTSIQVMAFPRACQSCSVGNSNLFRCHSP
jgi:transcription initiation factor TFIID subunit 2